MPGAYLLQGDARAIPLADASVQCVVTSPPYWGLRDYGVSEQLGLEDTPGLYVAHLVEVFREVRRVLRADGTCWLNLGDSYNAGRDGGHPGGKRSGFQQVDARYNDRSGANAPGLKPKDLVGIPWRVAFALQADGWWLRSDIVWSKPNPMPESITDRPTKAHEYLFLLTKSARYYYDAEAIKEPAEYREPNSPQSIKSPYGQGFTRRATKAETSPRRDGNLWNECNGRGFTPTGLGRNRRTVWTIATEPYPEAHFATFPEKLVEPCILAGTSERGACVGCGAPYARDLERTAMVLDRSARTHERGRTRSSGTMLAPATAWARGWAPTCDCPEPAPDPVPCRVLDPFAGSGTTVAVAERLGRVGIGVELKPEYLTLARRRTAQAGLL